jgi:hypothetical protein
VEDVKTKTIPREAEVPCRPMLGAMVSVVSLMREYDLPEPTRIEFREAARADAIDVLFSARLGTGSFLTYEQALAAMNRWADALHLARDVTPSPVSSRRHGQYFELRFWLTATGGTEAGAR